ncbi:MAG: hypothetical protein JSU05_03655, partial [Bacteroidetes bacterium]|nr:hypothetical protein [Bacteroidota bacterium]
PLPATDSFTVTVANGYGSGKYKSGDTVHIFSTAYPTNQTFDTWSSTDVSLLNAKDEWNTWFVMPAKNVSFSGAVKTAASYTLQYEQIRGRDRMKPVYYYFPLNHKGIVYLLHGTGGSASNVANSFEFQLLMRDLITDGFAVIITEAEEATTGVDSNGDGKIRWNTTPWDTTTNVDYANIRILTDTFYNRGVTNRSIPLYSIGMSNGGNFSASLATIYKFKTGISYCAPAGSPIALTSTTPIQFCMARYDNNENVGPAGNANALDNSQTLSGRGICSKYFIKEHSPLYPERFARRGDISITQSTAVFNELKAKGFLDSKNYFIGYSDTLTSAYLANPSSFPALGSLNLTQKLFVTEQIDLAVSDHQMYSDYNKASLKFLNTQCQ